MPCLIEGREPRAGRFSGITGMIEVQKETRGRATTVLTTRLVIDVKSECIRRYQAPHSGVASLASMERV